MQFISQHVRTLASKGAVTAAIGAAADFARRYPGDPVPFFLLAQAEETAGYTRAAIQSISQAISLDPDKPDFRILRARLYLKDRRLAEAIRDVNCVIASDDPSTQHYRDEAIACRNELMKRQNPAAGPESPARSA